eukprot:TRINITY_DN238_c0_g1_i12.p9 TRINITY_DN238_c0_g1~~TRINITY_DN238_c0_g1_i12.p9  ORF type:complete len:108 (-),score=3.07 TRINITY_DN238_c0_g1_i12:1558-1881(-)
MGRRVIRLRAGRDVTWNLCMVLKEESLLVLILNTSFTSCGEWRLSPVGPQVIRKKNSIFVRENEIQLILSKKLKSLNELFQESMFCQIEKDIKLNQKSENQKSDFLN